MADSKTSIKRRSFLKVTALAGGGLLINFSWLPAFGQISNTDRTGLPEDWIEINGFIKITPDNVIKILNPNPDFGQNVMTSLPMIVAEELDADWKKVVVEMALHNTKLGPQFVGGSNSVRMYWKPLREAGATGRYMLMQAAAETWKVPVQEVTTKASMLYHKKSGRSGTYGSFASKAATLPVPKNVKLKDVNDFKIVGHSQQNVEGLKIVTGVSLFGLDYKSEGMLIAMIEHPPAFGMKIQSFDASETLKMPGIKDVFTLKLYEDGFEQAGFDTRSFNDLLVVVGKTTWEVMKARKKLKVLWEPAGDIKDTMAGRGGGGKREVIVPGELESTSTQLEKMKEHANKPATEL